MTFAIVIMLLSAVFIGGSVALFKALLVAVAWNLVYIFWPVDAFIILYMITSMGVVISHVQKRTYA